MPQTMRPTTSQATSTPAPVASAQVSPGSPDSNDAERKAARIPLAIHRSGKTFATDCSQLGRMEKVRQTPEINCSAMGMITAVADLPLRGRAEIGHERRDAQAGCVGALLPHGAAGVVPEDDRNTGGGSADLVDAAEGHHPAPGFSEWMSSPN